MRLPNLRGKTMKMKPLISWTPSRDGRHRIQIFDRSIKRLPHECAEKITKKMAAVLHLDPDRIDQIWVRKYSPWEKFVLPFLSAISWGTIRELTKRCESKRCRKIEMRVVGIRYRPAPHRGLGEVAPPSITQDLCLLWCPECDNMINLLTRD